MYRRRYTIVVALFLLASLLLLALPVPGTALPVADSGSDGNVRFEGMVEAIGLQKWLIEGITVFVSASTEIIEEAGSAEVGAWVTVEATWRWDGNLWADRIRVERPAGVPGRIIEFTGLIELFEAERWVVGGVEVYIPPEAVIEGQPKMGVPAWVQAQWQGDRWLALEIAVYPAIGDERQVQFEGLIEAVGPSLWVISGLAVEVNEDTTVAGVPMVGRWAEVTAYLCPGGRIWAQHILVLPPNGDQIAEFEGIVRAIHTDREPQEWEIIELEPGGEVNEVVVFVDGNTLVDQSRAVAAPGMWASVMAYEDGGSLWGQRIRIERTFPVEVEGTLEATSPVPPGWWQVDGLWVYVHQQTVVVGSPLTGMRVYVEGLMLGNGCIWAERVWPM